MTQAETITMATVPMQAVGPVKILGTDAAGDFMAPLATFESPLWPSVGRGARVSVQCGGVRVTVTDDRMARSVLLAAPDAAAALQVVTALRDRSAAMAAAAEAGSRHAKFLGWHHQLAANLIYLRLEISTGDAAGHNMATAAAENLLNWLLAEYPQLRYLSISGNYCCDKKPSAVNGILGRGKHAIAEAVIPAAVCARDLRTTPAKMAELNLHKNYLGTLLAGGVRSANAHFANMLLAFYLATGQDAANIVEGSQGFTHAEDRGGDLYFAVTVPHLIVGTVGNGKDLDFVRRNLQDLGCLEPRAPGANARRLAAVAAAVVWCGELSLLAAQTNPGELMRAHRRLERRA